MTEIKEKKIVRVHCPKCGGGYRNHQILESHYNNWSDGDKHGDEHVSGSDHYQICQCLGCDTVRFRHTSWFSEDYDPETGSPEEHIRVYPEVVTDGRGEVDDLGCFPEKIRLIYSETVKAFNCGANILAAGGLRAIVEAICKDQEVSDSNLEMKIDQLKAKSFLTQSQADLLHEERFIGNKALHEIESPKISDLKDGLDIIEGMLATIYILPEKAKRLKKSRTTKK